jgi:hypothetical protein
MDALVINGLAAHLECRILKGLEPMKDKVEDLGSDADSEASDQLLHLSLSLARLLVSIIAYFSHLSISSPTTLLTRPRNPTPHHRPAAAPAT